MITNDNLKFYFEDLNKQQIRDLADADGDFVAMRLSIFNAGAVAHAERGDYDEEIEEEIQGEGGVYCDMDTFLQLYIDSKAFNKHIEIELI